MTRRVVFFGIFTVVAATICVRLGIWQLHRLGERRAKNALVYARGREATLPMSALRTADTSTTHWRRVRVHGVADYSAEVIQTSRSQSGAPGVYLLTPVRPLEPGWGDTSLLVLRGFLYSANGRSADFVKAREGDTLTIDALVTAFQPHLAGDLRSPSSPNAVRLLDRDTIAAIVQRPLANAVLLALGDTTTKDVTLPARVPPPAMSDGPHLSYALQWFGFATVFIAGFVAYVVSTRATAKTNETDHAG